MFQLFDDLVPQFPDGDFHANRDSDTAIQDGIGESDAEGGFFESANQVVDEVKSWFGNPDVMKSGHFDAGGSFDPVNGCIVEGDVLDDMAFVDQQTHGSCSLMAQEQFVERWIGEDVPEQVLEDIAGNWGVYTPEGGTNFAGQDAVLDYFGVPHQRYPAADIEMLEQAIANGDDAILGVDAREFYCDPMMPPNSGHAVSVVGRGIDPATQATKGFYFTDSNYPGTTRFVSVEKLSGCWFHDMIVVSTSQPTTGIV